MPRPTPPDERVIARRRQVGDRIRRVREHLNLTQQDVCGPSGIDIATYSRIENGHSSPVLDTLIRIADAMGVELDELTNLLRRLFKVRDVLLKVNLAYIESAAQDDRYRTAPPFRLQGSYRNMARLAPQVTPLMQDGELDALLRDHYRGEAQTLTTGAEENLLQLAHLIGRPTLDEAARWAEISDSFQRQRKLGGADDDPSVRVTRGLLDISRGVDALAQQQRSQLDTQTAALQALRESTQALNTHSDSAQEQRMVDALLSLSVTYRQLIMPLVRAIETRMGVDAKAHQEVEKLEHMIDGLRKDPKKS